MLFTGKKKKRAENKRKEKTVFLFKAIFAMINSYVLDTKILYLISKRNGGGGGVGDNLK